MTPDGLFGLLSSVSCGAFVLATDQTVVFWNRRAREILGYTPDRVVGRRCSGITPGVEGITLTGDCEDGCLMLRSLRAGLVPVRARLRMRCAWGEWKVLVVTPMVVSGVEEHGPLLAYMFGDSDQEVASVDVQRLVELGGGGDRYTDDLTLVIGNGEPEPTNDDVEPHARLIGSAEPPQPFVYESDLFFEDPESGTDAERPEPSDIDQGEGRTGAQPRDVRLTEREREVLSYLALGWETRYIAEELGVSWYTARNHVRNIRQKLDASTRLEAIMTAMRLGILPSA